MKTKVKQTLAALSLMGASLLANAGVAVVVGANSPLAEASSNDVVKIFLGKKKDHGGAPVVPIDQAEGSTARSEFYSNVVKKSETKV